MFHGDLISSTTFQAASHCSIGAAAVHESAAMQKKERSLLALGTRMSWESCWPGNQRIANLVTYTWQAHSAQQQDQDLFQEFSDSFHSSEICLVGVMVWL